MERIQPTEESLSFPTFRLHITKKPARKYWVLEFAREAEVFLTGIEIMTSANVKKITNYQLASVVIDAVSLFLKAMGIIVSMSESKRRATLKVTAKAIQNSTQLRRAILAFFAAWKEAGGSMMGKAYALVCLVWQCSVLGILWSIIKSVIEEMSWWEMSITFAQVSTSLYTLCATPTVALRLTTVSFLADLHGLTKKIHELYQIMPQ